MRVDTYPTTKTAKKNLMSDTILQNKIRVVKFEINIVVRCKF